MLLMCRRVMGYMLRRVQSCVSARVCVHMVVRVWACVSLCACVRKVVGVRACVKLWACVCVHVGVRACVRLEERASVLASRSERVCGRPPENKSVYYAPHVRLSAPFCLRLCAFLTVCAFATTVLPFCFHVRTSSILH